jgi:hypothetical protein
MVVGDLSINTGLDAGVEHTEPTGFELRQGSVAQTLSLQLVPYCAWLIVHCNALLDFLVPFSVA